MVKLSISEYSLLSTTDAMRQEILAMMREYADASTVDWHLEIRTAEISEENFFLAQIKYPRLIPLFRRH